MEPRDGGVGMSGVAAAVPVWFRGRSGVLGAILALAVPGPANGQFSAQPVIMEMSASQGSTAAAFSVRNESDAPLQFRIYVSDYDQAEAGGTVFLDLGTHERTCAGRIDVFPDNLVLSPRESGEVRVRMAPGDSTCWSLVFVQSTSRGTEGVRIAQRIGVRVYGVAPDARAEGEVRAVAVSKGDDGSDAVAIDFRNTGSAPLRPDGELEIRSLAGDVVAVIPVAPFSVLPGRTGRASVRLDAGLSPGRYLLIPILDFGGDYLAGGQAWLEVEET